MKCAFIVMRYVIAQMYVNFLNKSVNGNDEIQF